MIRRIFTTSLLLLTVGNLIAQVQPFEEYGYKVKIGTLSNGKYEEFFDQDSLMEIGSVILNRFTGRVVYFIQYDTTYSESDLKPDVISRWMSPDPLADERYDYSPYNFVRNNPIIFVDPTGALDEYYGIVDDKLVYLGSDGQGNNIRLVSEGRHEEALPLLNGGNTSQEQVNTLRDGSMSQVVTFDESAIQTEVQGANDRTITNGKENSFIVTLDPASATVSAQAGREGTSTTIENNYKSFNNSDGKWTQDGSKLALGEGHGHPTETRPGLQNTPGYSQQDSKTSGTIGIAYYTMDSYSVSQGGNAAIHQAQPGGKNGRSGTNQVGTTQSTNGLGQRSFLQTARPYQR